MPACTAPSSVSPTIPGVALLRDRRRRGRWERSGGWAAHLNALRQQFAPGRPAPDAAQRVDGRAWRAAVRAWQEAAPEGAAPAGAPWIHHPTLAYDRLMQWSVSSAHLPSGGLTPCAVAVLSDTVDRLGGTSLLGGDAPTAMAHLLARGVLDRPALWDDPAWRAVLGERVAWLAASSDPATVRLVLSLIAAPTLRRPPRPTTPSAGRPGSILTSIRSHPMWRTVAGANAAVIGWPFAADPTVLPARSHKSVGLVVPAGSIYPTVTPWLAQVVHAARARLARVLPGAPLVRAGVLFDALVGACRTDNVVLWDAIAAAHPAALFAMVVACNISFIDPALAAPSTQVLDRLTDPAAPWNRAPSAASATPSGISDPPPKSMDLLDAALQAATTPAAPPSSQTRRTDLVLHQVATRALLRRRMGVWSALTKAHARHPMWPTVLVDLLAAAQPGEHVNLVHRAVRSAEIDWAALDPAELTVRLVGALTDTSFPQRAPLHALSDALSRLPAAHRHAVRFGVITALGRLLAAASINDDDARPSGLGAAPRRFAGGGLVPRAALEGAMRHLMADMDGDPSARAAAPSRWGTPLDARSPTDACWSTPPESVPDWLRPLFCPSSSDPCSVMVCDWALALAHLPAVERSLLAPSVCAPSAPVRRM